MVRKEEKMLNQFTGIGKVVRTYLFWNDTEEKHCYIYTIQLCSDENKEEYIFNGNCFTMYIEEEKQKKEIKENDIVSFKGHYFDKCIHLKLDSIKVV